jgi:outer membrane protein insertion porin family
MRISNSIFLTLLLICHILPISSHASGYASKKPYQILIKGSNSISEQFIKSYFNDKSLKGDINEINKSVKELYDSALFEKNIEVDVRKSDIIITVKERKKIASIEFAENRKIKDEDLRRMIKSQKGNKYSSHVFNSDKKTIIEEYMKRGFFATEIKVEEEVENNSIKLKIIINEGKRVKLRNINFIGNKAFNQSELEDKLYSKTHKWYKLINSKSFYNHQILDVDKQSLEIFYKAHGYMDFKLVSANAELSNNKEEFFVTLHLYEGQKYIIDNVTISSENVDSNHLFEGLKIAQGDVYNQSIIIKSIDVMQDIVAEYGYAFSTVEPQFDKDQLGGKVDIDFVIKKMPKVYVNRIIVSGNHRTNTEVILRELRISEGDPLSPKKIKRSQNRLDNLGFFKDVKINYEKVANSDKANLFVELEESQTGQLSFGVGYSTAESLTANFGIKENNFIGRGESIELNLERSKYQMNGIVGYKKRYFMNHDIGAGFSIFRNSTSKGKYFSYDRHDQGLSFDLLYSINDYLRHNIGYYYSIEKVNNIDSSSSSLVQDLRGVRMKSIISNSISFNKLNSRLSPTKGYYASFSHSFSGVGGGVKYNKLITKFKIYQPIVEDNIIYKFSTNLGYIDSIDDDLIITDNFLLGGPSFRGFEYAGIGPRLYNGIQNKKDGDALGGKFYNTISNEIIISNPTLRDLGFKFIIFNDIGTLRLTDYKAPSEQEILADSEIRASCGLGFVWTSPIGPLRFDFSRVLKKEDYDREENFRFSIDNAF